MLKIEFTGSNAYALDPMIGFATNPGADTISGIILTMILRTLCNRWAEKFVC